MVEAVPGGLSAAVDSDRLAQTKESPSDFSRPSSEAPCDISPAFAPPSHARTGTAPLRFDHDHVDYPPLVSPPGFVISINADNHGRQLASQEGAVNGQVGVCADRPGAQ